MGSSFFAFYTAKQFLRRTIPLCGNLENPGRGPHSETLSGIGRNLQAGNHSLIRNPSGLSTSDLRAFSRSMHVRVEVNLARREIYIAYQFSTIRSHILLSNRESLRCNLTRSYGFQGQNAAASAKDRLASAKTPRLLDPRGSRRDGGRSETRPRVKSNLDESKSTRHDTARL